MLPLQHTYNKQIYCRCDRIRSVHLGFESRVLRPGQKIEQKCEFTRHQYTQITYTLLLYNYKEKLKASVNPQFNIRNSDFITTVSGNSSKNHGKIRILLYTAQQSKINYRKTCVFSRSNRYQWTRVEDVREKRQQCNIVKPVRKKKLKINEITVKSNDSRGTRVAGGQTSAPESSGVFQWTNRDRTLLQCTKKT